MREGRWGSFRVAFHRAHLSSRSFARPPKSCRVCSTRSLRIVEGAACPRSSLFRAACCLVAAANADGLHQRAPTSWPRGWPTAELRQDSDKELRLFLRFPLPPPVPIDASLILRVGVIRGFRSLRAARADRRESALRKPKSVIFPVGGRNDGSNDGIARIFPRPFVFPRHWSSSPVSEMMAFRQPTRGAVSSSPRTRRHASITM